MTNTATDGKSPVFSMNQMSSSLRSWCMAHSGMGVLGMDERTWGGAPGLTWSYMLLVTFDETLVVSL